MDVVKYMLSRRLKGMVRDLVESGVDSVPDATVRPLDESNLTCTVTVTRRGGTPRKFKFGLTETAYVEPDQPEEASQ